MGVLKVLLVDDEPDFVAILKKRMEGWGYDFVVAEDGLKAMDALKSEKPDIVILDYMMPGMNGVAVLKEIRKKYKNLPVVMFTAYPEESIKEAKKLHVDAFVPKLSEYADTMASLRTSLELISKKLDSTKK